MEHERFLPLCQGQLDGQIESAFAQGRQARQRPCADNRSGRRATHNIKQQRFNFEGERGNV